MTVVADAVARINAGDLEKEMLLAQEGIVVACGIDGAELSIDKGYALLRPFITWSALAGAV